MPNNVENNSENRPITVYAPGSIGNVGPGFDVLGLAVEGAGDRVTVTPSEKPGIHVRNAGHSTLPSDPLRNSAAIAARAVLRRSGVPGALSMGLWIDIEKGLPLSGGQGGSAASAAAGAMATNLLLGEPLSAMGLVVAALEAEAVVAGRHADNVAPAVLGGFVLILALEPLNVVQLPPPTRWKIVRVLPDQEVKTAAARSVVPVMLPRETAIRQAARVAALVLAVTRGDDDLLRRAMVDEIAEPVRAALLPGFCEAKRAALAAGALGCSISGSGPTAFAFATDEGAPAVLEAMVQAYGDKGIQASGTIGRVDELGARRVEAASPTPASA